MSWRAPIALAALPAAVSLLFAAPVAAQGSSQQTSAVGSASAAAHSASPLSSSEAAELTAVDSHFVVHELHGPELELGRTRQSTRSAWQTLSIANPSVAAYGPSDAARYGDDDADVLDLVSGVITDRDDPRSLASTALLEVVHRRSADELSFVAQGNYARAPYDRSIHTAVNNVRAEARYEHALTTRWSLVFGASGRHDSVAELDLRLNLSPSLAAYVVRSAEHRAWLEAGYDFEVDAIDPPRGIDERARQVRHGYRARAAYEHALLQGLGLRSSGQVRRLGLDRDTWRAEGELGLKLHVSQKSNLASMAIVRVNDSPALHTDQTVESVTALRLEHEL
jgi:hypothetical protein